jgi:hypothetical protein
MEGRRPAAVRVEEKRGIEVPSVCRDSESLCKGHAGQYGLRYWDDEGR